MTEKQMEECIADALYENDEIKLTKTFEEVGMLTNNAGLVVRTIDGSEFQITIVKSR
jgi:hypothetical protein